MPQTPFDELSGERSGALDALSGRELPVPAAAQSVEPLSSPAFTAAKDILGLTPQEQNLYQLHLHNLSQGGVPNQGQTSTLFSATFEIGGKTYVIPTVWNGQILEPNAALEQARHIGLDQFPSYASEQEAQKRYDKMHQFFEHDLKEFKTQSKAKPAGPGAPLNIVPPGIPHSQADQSTKLAGDVVKMPGAATPPERISNALKTEDLNKLSTQRTLMRALGGGAQVLPIKPEDK
jgi:hypothetical protein